jgi:hypothetical protein
MRDYSRLFRTFSHSLTLEKNGMQRVFRFTPGFAQVRVKPISQWRTPRILGEVEDAVSFPCVVIRIGETITTTCYVTKEKLVIGGYKEILCGEIRAVLKRMRARKDSALEFFLRDGKSYLVDFTPSESNEIIKALRMCRFDKIEWFQRTSWKEFFKKIGDTTAWVDRKMSNFDYLMRVNIFGGRSFRDISAYPILPWIVINFESGSLDLTCETNFRKFKQTIGDNGLLSSPGIVAHWLARLEPFSSLPVSSLEPFHAIELTGANWELVPEFFCQPDFLLGHSASGERQFNDVKLPAWSANAVEFVYQHRKALESEYVSSHLHEWIDLVFGIENAGQFPILLFENPHPTRGKSIQQPIQNPWKFTFEKHPLIGSALVSVDTRECRFLNLQKDGSFGVQAVTYGTGCRSVSVTETISLQGMKMCEVFKSTIVVIGDDSVVIRSSGIIKVNQLDIQCVSVTNDMVVFLLGDGVLSILSMDNGVERKVCSILYERPVALAAHCDFDLLVVATLERNLLFYSLSSGIFRIRADLNGELVVQMVITDGWGFVVVLTNDSIHIFSVNGIRIRRVVNMKRIVLFCTWKSAAGFDYLCGSDNGGRLMICEAFYGNFDSQLCQIPGSVRWLNFVGAINCISAIIVDGMGFLFPCPTLQ